MTKFSLDSINDFYMKHKKIIDERRDVNLTEKIDVLICSGTGCQSAYSSEIHEKFQKLVADNNLGNKVDVNIVGCFGFCEKGPIVKVLPDDAFYVKVKPDDVDEIFNEHIVNGKTVDRLLYVNPANNETIKKQHNMPFYQKQVRLALRNCGLINPETFEESIGAGVYQAICKILKGMSQEAVIKIMQDSNLRGRGGGGFPTGRKWQFGYSAEGDQKYIICNADEGDPGAFMDRSILEGDPHSVLEGMMIAGYAIGADTGYIYVRAEYPLAIHRLKIAIEQAREHGLLGENILGSEFSFDIEIKYGAGAFVCGEETALINSIEGLRGEPRNKPPYPANKGVFQKPTVVNNVETLVNVPLIINEGSEWFRQFGTENSPGTKVFALAGKINNVGLVEVPMGLTLRELVYDVGGGIKDGKELKAVQTGGPSGGCIPPDLLDTPIEYDTLLKLGSMMGSGGVIILDEDNCMVNLSKFYLEFTLDESCGKCTPCRIGNTRLYEILDRITKGNGTKEDLVKLENLSQTIKRTSLCGLGQTSPNPVLSSLVYFYDEYRAHIEDGNCPSGVCKDLLTYFITDKCIGCTKCARVCPAECISGEVKKLHIIDQDRCIKCDSCYQVCPVNAITKSGNITTEISEGSEVMA